MADTAFRFVLPVPITFAVMARRFISILVALALFGGAGFAVLVSWATNWLACENQGTPACARQDLASAALALALVGLVPALVLFLAVIFGRHRVATAAAIVGVASYLVWAVVLDAAVHGWDDLTLLP